LVSGGTTFKYAVGAWAKAQGLNQCATVLTWVAHVSPVG
jgi:hypothetical protein